MTQKVKFKLHLGWEVRDRVTGYVGIVDARRQHLNECIQYSIQPRVDKEGKYVSGYWIDEAQLEFVSDGIAKKSFIMAPGESKAGGPTEVSGREQSHA